MFSGVVTAAPSVLLRGLVLCVCLAALGCSDADTRLLDAGLASVRDAGDKVDANDLPGVRCRSDLECQDGFCDRTGRCEQIDDQTRFGAVCTLPARAPQGFAIGLLNTCGAYPCLQGRCRSCMEDRECQIEYGAPSCRRLGVTRGYRCGAYGPGETQPPASRLDSGVLSADGEDMPVRLTVEVLRTYPHDRAAFTEGLIYANGELLEGTGIEGESQLRRVALETGEVLRAIDLPGDVFGEGIALHDDRIVQLTWQSERAFVWDARTLAAQGEHRYSGSGWGLCHDGQQFVMSDGSSTLQLRDSESFELTDTIELDAAATPFRNLRLNELECVGDEVFANVFEYREIARISLSQRKVTAWIDTRNLLNHADVPTDMLSEVRDLNGIAHIAESGHLLLTGKRWPRIFEVRLVPDDLFQ